MEMVTARSGTNPRYFSEMLFPKSGIVKFSAFDKYSAKEHVVGLPIGLIHTILCAFGLDGRSYRSLLSIPAGARMKCAE